MDVYMFAKLCKCIHDVCSFIVNICFTCHFIMYHLSYLLAYIHPV